MSKTKEIVFDFRKKKSPLVPLTIAGEVVEEVRTLKFLGITIACNRKWDGEYPRRQQESAAVAIEGILTLSVTVWYSSEDSPHGLSDYRQ